MSGAGFQTRIEIDDAALISKFNNPADFKRLLALKVKCPWECFE